MKKKLLQYADDTTAVLSDVNSARILFKLLDDFKKLSGLAINPRPPKRKVCGLDPPEEIKQNLLELNGQMNLSKLWESITPMIQNYF